jgi:Acetyltransferase (GNAT) domain
VELRGDGLVLRLWREDDADSVYLACQDPEILHWMPSIPRPYTRVDAQAFVTGRLDLGPLISSRSRSMTVPLVRSDSGQ